MFRTSIVVPRGQSGKAPFDILVLQHDERRLRRKVLRLQQGDEVLVDFAQTITLEANSCLQLEDGRLVEIIAAEELLYEVRARDRSHLVRLAWHLGNRHTSAQLEETRILIKRDHVLKAMLEGLGATVSDVSEPFFAEHGAYHSHGEQPHALLAR